MKSDYMYDYKCLIEKFLDDRGYNLCERLPRDIYRKIGNYTYVPMIYIKNVIRSIRVEREITVHNHSVPNTRPERLGIKGD